MLNFRHATGKELESLRPDAYVNGMRNKRIFAAILFAASIAGCSTTSAPPALSSKDQTELASLPAGMATVVQSEPVPQQRAFLDLPDSERGAVISQWSNREQVTNRFTPAERMLISVLSREESDRFFALPASGQEDYLVKVVERNANALRSCMTATHRRLGDAP
jgi:hypothetical protein